jgi:hypothetical protein
MLQYKTGSVMYFSGKIYTSPGSTLSKNYSVFITLVVFLYFLKLSYCYADNFSRAGEGNIHAKLSIFT